MKLPPLLLHALPLLASVLAACAADPVTSPWNVADHLPVGQVIIQSHRGAGVLAEENTVSAFELGWRLGTYPESDLRTTRDGVIVTFHDENFSRVVKGVTPELAKKGVKDLTYAELMQLDVGAWRGSDFQGRRVSKLTDAFAAMSGHPERHLYLDIKNVDFPQLARLVKEAHVEKQIVLASPKPEQIRAWKALVPESDTLLWMRGTEAQLRQRIADLEAAGFPGITQIQVHIFPTRTLEEALAIAGITAQRLGLSLEEAKKSAEPYTVSRAFLSELGERLRAHHILFQVLPYTDDPAIYAPLLDLGVMSFATDHPDVVVRELKAYYARRSAPRQP